jgi:hypothetical protein
MNRIPAWPDRYRVSQVQCRGYRSFCFEAAAHILRVRHACAFPRRNRRPVDADGNLFPRSEQGIRRKRPVARSMNTWPVLNDTAFGAATEVHAQVRLAGRCELALIFCTPKHSASPPKTSAWIETCLANLQHCTTPISLVAARQRFTRWPKPVAFGVGRCSGCPR